MPSMYLVNAFQKVSPFVQSSLFKGGEGVGVLGGPELPSQTISYQISCFLVVTIYRYSLNCRIRYM